MHMALLMDEEIKNVYIPALSTRLKTSPRVRLAKVVICQINEKRDELYRLLAALKKLPAEGNPVNASSRWQKVSW